MRVVATAGHVDHGKSTLVSALTGIDPDRLKEEKSREMTIDLGFAWMDLPSGETVGIIDVPGHRDFLENMLAGVGSIDTVIFVIAADEGIMPQTREHLAIIDLLKIKTGVIALTKVDLVYDQEWMDLVLSDIKMAIIGTCLENSPIVPVSSRTGSGMQELAFSLDKILSSVPPSMDKGRPRLSVDRVFTISGFGTIVTGTLNDGSLKVGNEVTFLPSGVTGRIRGLQTHKQKLLEIHPGSRAAVNVAGINVEDVHRGEILTYPGCYDTSKLFDVYIDILKEAKWPLKNNSDVKIFHMASERVGKVHVIGNNEIKPGEGGYAQIVTIEPMVLYKHDRFIIRIPSPGETIGGGVILRSVSKKRIKKSSFQDEISKLRALKDGTIKESILEILSQNGISDIVLISKKMDLQPELFSKELEQLVTLGEIKALNLSNNSQIFQKYCLIGFWKSISQNIHEIIENYHKKYPLRIGITREELRSRAKNDARQYNEILDELLSLQEIKVTDRLIHLPDHQVNISSSNLINLDLLQKLIDENPFTPPSVNEACEIIGQELFNAMLHKKEFVRVSTEIFFRKTEFEKMKEFVVNNLLSEGNITVKEFRDSFNSSRKYSLAFLEYFDSIGITIRQGDIRVPGKNQ